MRQTFTLSGFDSAPATRESFKEGDVILSKGRTMRGVVVRRALVGGGLFIVYITDNGCTHHAGIEHMRENWTSLGRPTGPVTITINPED